MALTDFSLRFEDVEGIEWEDCIQNNDESQYSVYSGIFFRESEKSENEVEQYFYELLGHVTSPMLRSDSDNEPFSPVVVMPDGSRSAIPRDLNKEKINFLTQLAPTVKNSEIRARIADIIWEDSRNSQMAQIAVSAYLETAKRLESSETWVTPYQRIQRAIKIAIRLGRESNEWKITVCFVKELIERHKTEEISFFLSKLMGLLLDDKILEYKTEKEHLIYYADLSKTIAINSENTQKWELARKYWEVARRLYGLLKDQENQNCVKIKVADTYVKESEEHLSSSTVDYISVTHCLQKAIEEYRRVGKMKEKIEELHKSLLQYQSIASEQFKNHSFEMNITDIANQAMSKVKNLTFREAIFQLALMGISPKVEEIRVQLKEAIRDYPLQFMMGSVFYNESGKVTALKPGINFSPSDESESVFQASMAQFAHRKQQFFASAIILPAIDQIRLEHNPCLDDFGFLVSSNPLVPPGREIIYARGLLEGLRSDFLVATHLLIPQIEHSIRYLMEARGHIVSGLNTSGIQDEHNVNKLLDRPELKEILGEDIIFDLKVLLVDRFGSNLRNRMAHGLMDSNNFFMSDNVYLWWLTLHLCSLPVLQRQTQILE